RSVGAYDVPGSLQITGLAVSNKYAFVTIEDGGLEVIDLSNPADPHRLGGYAMSGVANAVAVSGNYAYVTESRWWNGTQYLGGGLHVIDISNAASPQRLGVYPNHQPVGAELFNSDARSVAVYGNYAYVNFGEHLEVIDVSNPANPRQVGHDFVIGPSRSMFAS